MENLLKNPKFYMAIIAVIVLVIVNFIPDFALDQEAAAAALVIVAGYLYGVIVDPGANTWVSMLKSRKFWAAVVGEVAIWLSAFKIELPFGLAYEQIIDLVMYVVTSLILAFAHIQTDTPAVKAKTT